MTVEGTVYLTLLLTVTLRTICTSANLEVEVSKTGTGMSEVLNQLLKQHSYRCHLVLITTTQESQIFSHVLRSEHLMGAVVVDVGSASTGEQFLRGLWGDTRTTCRALVLHITSKSNATNMALRLLETTGLWQRPETRVIVVGEREGVEAVLLHPSLRNTIHSIYLSTHHQTLDTSPHQELSDAVSVYRKCLYCNTGETTVQLVPKRSINSLIYQTDNLSPGLLDMQGYTFRIVTVPYFPYMDFTRDTAVRGTTVTPKDSLDNRIISSLAAALNFTYVINEEPNRSFGEDRKGVFTGMIGQLQREESDFSTIVAPTPGRLKVVEFLRTYPSDPLTITSLKPSLLPAHLSLLRPFEGELWLALLLSVVGWGVILWLMQKMWRWVAGGPGLRFSSSLLYGWGALLEHPPKEPSVSTSGRVLLGWWLVFCLIITTGFRSSLIAHLTVQGTTEPLDSFEDLLDQNDWQWAIEPWLYKGATLEYFSKHKSPVVNKINSEMKVLGADDALGKVSAGRFSLIDHMNYILVYVASWYTDAKGDTPFYVSNKGISVIAAFGWGFRKGAPFYQSFSKLINQLEDSGIIHYWTDTVIARRVRENREAVAVDSKAGFVQNSKESRDEALGLHHLQGAFYILLLGCSLAFITLLTEKLTYINIKPQ